MAAASSRQRLRVAVQVAGKGLEVLVVPTDMGSTVQAFAAEVAR